MIGLGTIINAVAVILGGVLGIFFGHLLTDTMQDMLMKSSGVAVIFLGIAGTLEGMLTVNPDGTLAAGGSMLLVFSLVIGGLLGELLRIEDGMEWLGEAIRRRVDGWMQRRHPTWADDPNNRFVEGFVTTSLIICVGAMAIVGAIQDGLTGDYTMLAAKAVLDLVIVVVFSATYGIGSAFSAIPIFVYQGSITLLAASLDAVLTTPMIDGMSFIGSALIFCVGINIVFGKQFRVGNMLPAILVPIVSVIFGIF